MGCFSYRICLYTENQMCSKLDVNWVWFCFFFCSFFLSFLGGKERVEGLGVGLLILNPVW